jgi:hypothetical protein
MKAKNLFPVFLLFILASACNNDKKEKDSTTQTATGDSTVAEEKLPSLEKEFADTLDVKPVKESVLLKFNFQKGKTYNYNMNFDVAQKKGEQSRTTTMKWNYDMQVVDEKGNIKTIKTTYKRIEMAMDMGTQKMEFSSEKKVDAYDFMQLPSKMFGIIKGKSFTMQVNDKGEVLSVSGFDKIGDAVINESGFPEEMKPMLQQNFKKQFNDDVVKQMFSQTFQIFPNRPVTIGDHWKINSTIAALKQEATTTFTVKNIKDNRVFISGISKMKSTDGTSKSTQTSKLIIDARTGLMVDGVFDQKSEDGSSTKSRIIGKEL